MKWLFEGRSAIKPNRQVKFSIEGVGKSPELKELKQILEREYPSLNSVFESIQRKSGVENPRELPRNIRLYSTDERTGGEMRPEVEDTIFLNSKSLEQNRAVSKKYSMEKYMPFLLLHTYIHEAVHRTGINIVEKTRVFKKPRRIQSGLIDIKNRHGWVLGEAVTEHLANVIMDEFLRRSAQFGNLAPAERKKLSFLTETSSYNEERKELFSFIALAALKLEVSEELLWQALTRQYFTGEIPLDEFHNALLDIADIGDTLAREGSGERVSEEEVVLVRNAISLANSPMRQDDGRPGERIPLVKTQAHRNSAARGLGTKQ